MSNCVLANASFCSSEHLIFCGPSLLRHSYDCHSIELQPLKNLFRLLDCLDDCCLVLSHNRNVTRAFAVCWACKSSFGHLATHLHHRHLSFDTLELWEPDAAPSWEHWQSHQSSRSVTTFKSSCAFDSNVLAFHHNGHLHDLIHEQYLDDLNGLWDLLDVRHQSLYYQRNDRRCRLHNWSVHHSVALPELNLKYSHCSLLNLDCRNLSA